MTSKQNEATNAVESSSNSSSSLSVSVSIGKSGIQNDSLMDSL